VLADLIAYPEPIIYLTSFLVGSIPFGLWVGRLFKAGDIRKRGSGNIGATNVSRIVGFRAGLLTFTLDLLKGAVLVLLLSREGLVHAIGVWTGETFAFSLSALWATGFFAVLGHCFSPWLHLKGGKGIATGFGALLVLSPVSALVGAIAYVLTFLDKKIGSISSIAGLSLASVSYLVLNRVGAHLWWGAAMVFLIILRHESNIDALLENREQRFD